MADVETPAQKKLREYGEETKRKLTEGDQVQPTPDNPRVNLTGDQDGGFIVDIHDGTTTSTHSPEPGTSAADAVESALTAHGEKVKAANRAGHGVPNAVKAHVHEVMQGVLGEVRAMLDEINATVDSKLAQLKPAASMALPLTETGAVVHQQGQNEQAGD